MTDIWNAISNLGTDSAFSKLENKKIRLLNQITFCITIGVLIQIAYSLYIGNTKVFRVCLVSFILYFLLFVLQSQKKTILSRWYFMFIVPFILTYCSLILPPKVHLEYLLLCSLMWPYMFFKKSKPLVFFSVYISVMIIFSMTYHLKSHIPLIDLSAEQAAVGAIVNMILAIISVILFIKSFKAENLRFEQQTGRLLQSLNKVNTKLVNKQLEVERQNRQLQSINNSLSRSQDLLEEKNKELEQFSYAVSHDLKEPLRMIGGYIQLLLKKVEHKKDKQILEFMDYILANVERMDQMLRGLLKYSKLGYSNYIPEKVDLNDTVEIIKNTMRLRIQESNAVINCSHLPTILSSKLLINQLFQNLIGNAIKFRSPDKTPKISIYSKVEKDKVVIAIQDNGIGISKKHQKDIFTMFKRLHTQDQYDGTGIGLALCLRISEKLDGQIWLESTSGQGTTFYVSLPRHVDVTTSSALSPNHHAKSLSY